jgi:hypothetical protein
MGHLQSIGAGDQPHERVHRMPFFPFSCSTTLGVGFLSDILGCRAHVSFNSSRPWSNAAVRQGVPRGVGNKSHAGQLAALFLSKMNI